MRYFTEEWHKGLLSDEEMDDKIDSYNQYLERIQPKLPFTLKMLTQKTNLHDGIITKVLCNIPKKELIVSGVFGDLQAGYFNMTIAYKNVQNLDILKIKNIFGSKESQILSDEIFLMNQQSFSHNILFSSYRELEIKFTDIELKINSVSPKNYFLKPCELEVCKI